MNFPLAPASIAGRVATFLAGIRGRMIVLLIAAGIPVIVIATGNALQGRESALEEGRRRLLNEREVALAQGGFHLEALESLIWALAQTDEVRAGNARGCAELLNHVITLHPGRYGNLFVIDGNGNDVCSGVPRI